MRIAVFSDIHGNLEALKSVLSDIKKRDIDNVICLGDLVGYGPFPNEVIKLIREENILTLRGNYDTAVALNSLKYIKDNELNKRFTLPWAVKEVTLENKNYLKSLPSEIKLKFMEKTIVFVHGSTRKVNEYLSYDSVEALEIMKELEGDVLICAHTHRPYKKEYDSKILINDGSVGKPKIGRPNSTYIILDINKDNLETELIEIEYNYKVTVQEMEKRDFPLPYVQSILAGIE